MSSMRNGVRAITAVVAAFDAVVVKLLPLVDEMDDDLDVAVVPIGSSILVDIRLLQVVGVF